MRHPRRAAPILAAIVAAVVTLLATGAPAYADDPVKVDVQGLGGNVAAGSDGVGLTVTFTNTTDQPISGVRVVLRVQLAGASVDAVRVRRQQGGGQLASLSGDDGSILFTDDDPFELKRKDNQTRRYQLSFRDSAPTGQAAVTVGAVVNGTPVGSGGGTVTVTGHGAGPGEQTTPANTNPGFIPSAPDQPSYSLAAPITQAAGEQTPTASVPKSLYLLGSLLVVMGALSLVLIFRAPGRVPARVSGPGPHQVPVAPSWHPRRSGPGGAPPVQAWPTVPRASEPARRPDTGPHTGPIRPVRDGGPHTGQTRSVRDPGPGNEPLPPWLRP